MNNLKASLQVPASLASTAYSDRRNALFTSPEYAPRTKSAFATSIDTTRGKAGVWTSASVGASRRFARDLRHRSSSLFGLARSGAEMLVQSRNGLTQAIWDHLGILRQRGLGIGMAEVSLQILYARERALVRKIGCAAQSGAP